MQRLFTTFAGGWPGFGLLVQRLITGIALLHHGMALFKETTTRTAIVPHAMADVLAIFIITGLWTPVAGALIAAVQVWIALASPGSAEMSILLAILAATVAMIGPGAFSIDARLFGRKQIRT